MSRQDLAFRSSVHGEYLLDAFFKLSFLHTGEQ